jgi:hypothetical protein
MIGEAMGIASSADIYGPSAGATFYQAQEKAPTTAAGIQSTASDTAVIQQVNVLPNLGKVNPLLWLPIGLGALVLFKLLREWGTKAEHFSPLKADFYWFGMTVGASCLGIPLVKAFFNKYKVEGLTQYINNA